MYALVVESIDSIFTSFNASGHTIFRYLWVLCGKSIDVVLIDFLRWRKFIIGVLRIIVCQLARSEDCWILID